MNQTYENLCELLRSAIDWLVNWILPPRKTWTALTSKFDLLGIKCSYTSSRKLTVKLEQSFLFELRFSGGIPFKVLSKIGLLRFYSNCSKRFSKCTFSPWSVPPHQSSFSVPRKVIRNFSIASRVGFKIKLWVRLSWNSVSLGPMFRNSGGYFSISKINFLATKHISDPILHNFCFKFR